MSQLTLYLPYTDSPRGAWLVRRNADVVGTFATREEAMRHARHLIGSIRTQSGQKVDIKAEDENGVWRVADIGD